MDRESFSALRTALKDRVDYIDNCRQITATAIQGFIETVRMSIATDGRIVSAGISSQGDFKVGEYLPNDEGGLDFEVRLKFDIGPSRSVHLVARMKALFDGDSKSVVFTELATGNWVTIDVSGAGSSSVSFKSAVPLLDEGIQRAAREYLASY